MNVDDCGMDPLRRHSRWGFHELDGEGGNELTDELTLLCGTAASVGALHTLLGPDHYLPFIAMSRAGRWSLCKTTLITLLCGLGHVLSSIALGVIGIFFGVAVFRLEDIERTRGEVAGWLLLAFGLIYFIWGVRRAIRNRSHAHLHTHVDGTAHDHEHRHAREHVHVHNAQHGTANGISQPARSMTPWILFVIFIFGPCEPLIPLLMYPAAKGHVWDVILVSTIFAVTTLTTMTAAVLLAYFAIGARTFRRMERYSHALAGFVVFLCGAAIMTGL